MFGRNCCGLEKQPNDSFKILCVILFQHLFPKAQVEVYIMVIEDDGGVLGASMTCASLALANASIPM